jgi:glycosyltransferase involved in cell wall biosynthesis
VFPFAKGKITFIPEDSNIKFNPIDNAQKADLRRSIGFSESDVILAFFGLLYKSKKDELLWLTLDSAVRKALPVKLLFIGESQAHVEALMPAAYTKLLPRIYCTDYQSDKMVSHFLQISNILLLPFEGGVSTKRSTYITGLLHSMPIVTTFGESTDRIIQEADFIRISDSDNWKAFIHNVLELINNPELMRKLGQKGYEFALKHYHSEVITKNIFGIIYEYSSSRRRQDSHGKYFFL